MQLLVVKKMSWVAAAAENVGVEVIEYAPDWILKIWEERDKYWTPDAVAQREARKKKLRELGYV
jgi:hypothetical protein